MSSELVLDTGPLSHLAQAGWIGVLRSVAGERKVVMTDAVEWELRQGLHANPHLRLVLDAEWISLRTLTTPQELRAFGMFAQDLVVGTRNIGEAAALAYAQVHSATAVVDDSAARAAAQRHDVSHTGTLGLLCEAIRQGLLTVAVVSDVADHLLETSYRLPFAPGHFAVWAAENCLVPAD